MAASVIDAITGTVGALPPETGGFLGVTDGVVDHFRFDSTAINTTCTYEPGIISANEERRFLQREGATFAGFVHSHPGQLGQPSLPDRIYAQLLWSKIRLDELLLPIVIPSRHGHAAQINWHVARPGTAGVADLARVRVVIDQDAVPGQFDRVRGAYDADWLAGCRVVAVGVGGARQALEDLVRIGVGQIVLIDPDVVAPENLATQGVSRRELGRPKVLACADALLHINPAISVVPVQRRVQDVPRRQLEFLLTGAWPRAGHPHRTLIGGWSDSVPANAYAHRTALATHLPYVQAGLHLGGVSGEVILVWPGHNRGRVRCATESRYRHYLGGGGNDAVSSGVPIWATARLNALKLCISAAALHAVEPGETGRISSERRAQTALLERIAARPLALLRLSPQAGEISGLRIHESLLAGCDDPAAFLFDETVWRPLEPRPGCPDCGGTGDLLQTPAFSSLDAIPEIAS